MKEQLYRLARHIAAAKGGLPAEWQDWAEEIETDLRRLSSQSTPVVYDAEPSFDAMMRALDAFYADDDVPERAMLAAFKILLADVRGQVQEPATDNTAQQFEALATSKKGDEEFEAMLLAQMQADGCAPNTEPCVLCGVVSSHPEGWHYCKNAQPATSPDESKLDARRRRNRQANARARAKETPEQANKRRANNRDRMRAARSGKQ